MIHFTSKYLSVIRQLNYFLFLAFVALLPYPQVFLRLVIVLWLATWLLEGRFLQKPKKEHLPLMVPFLLFGAWYLWKIISGLWIENADAYAWQLERYLSFGLIIPIGIWGVNEYYDWKQACKVLAISCIAAAGIYAFTMFWMYNANAINSNIGRVPLQDMPLSFFEGKISYIKHRLFLCSTEILGITALLYVRKDIIAKFGTVKAWIMIALGIAIMSALILATGSRASILSGAAILTIALLYKLPIRRMRYKVAFLLLASGIGVFSLCMHPRMQQFDYEELLSIRDVTTEHNIRLNIWGVALDNWREYSSHGLGAGQSFHFLQQKYSTYGLHNYNFYNAHNQYLEEWIEIGIPGLIFFILAWLSIPFCTPQHCRKSAIFLCALYMMNMLTDCMFGRFDGIALWCFWMILIRLQADTKTDQQPARNAQ